MRPLALSAAVITALLSYDATSTADAAAWCLRSREATNCGFYTYQQCMEARRGIGGWCEPTYDLRPYRPYRPYRD